MAKIKKEIWFIIELNYCDTFIVIYLINIYLNVVEKGNIHFFLSRPLDNLTVEGLVRLWAHEALRLFQDRLVEDAERQWTDENIDNVALRFFPGKILYITLVRV